MVHVSVLLVEKKLAVAHQMLWQAAREAENMPDQGLADDLYGLAMEVGRVNTDLLRSGKRRRPLAPDPA